MRRWCENQRAGIEHVRQRVGIVLRIGRNLSKGLVASRSNKFLELPVGDRGPVNPKTIDADLVRGPLFGIALIRAHAEQPAGYIQHVSFAFAA
jgi:hypothetical protein